MENTREEFHRLKESYKEQLPSECQNCGSDKELNIHHIVPLSVGGTNRISNLATLCEVCHGKVHGLERKGHGELIKAGKAIAKQREDFREGRPNKFGKQQIELALELLKTHSYKEVESKTGISKSTLIRAKRKLTN